MLVLNRKASLEVLLEFNSNYTQEGIQDVLALIYAEDIIKFSETDYLIKLDPMDYSLLQSLSTVKNNLLTQPLDYGY